MKFDLNDKLDVVDLFIDPHIHLISRL